MIELIRTLGLGAGVAVIAYKLITELLGPLVRHMIEKNKPEPDKKVEVLEVNLTTVTARVADLSNLVDERSAATDNKLDIVLQELKEIRGEHAAAHLLLSERLAVVETTLKHIDIRGPRR